MSSDTKTRLSRWLEPEVIITSLTLIVAVALAYSSIKSDVRDLATQMRQEQESKREADTRMDESRRQLEARVTGLEQARAADREVMVEVRSDVKYIKQQVDKQADKKP